MFFEWIFWSSKKWFFMNILDLVLNWINFWPKSMKNMNIQKVSARAILARNEQWEIRNKKLLSGCTCRVAKGDCGQGQSQGQVKVRHYALSIHNILCLLLVGPLPLYICPVLNGGGRGEWSRYFTVYGSIIMFKGIHTYTPQARDDLRQQSTDRLSHPCEERPEVERKPTIESQ